MTPVSFGSEGEVKARRPDLEELEVRDDERVAGTPEEDPDEGDEEPEDGEQREQDEGRDEHARHRRMEVGEQLLQAQEVPRRLGDRGRHVAVRELLERSVDE